MSVSLTKSVTEQTQQLPSIVHCFIIVMYQSDHNMSSNETTGNMSDTNTIMSTSNEKTEAV